ncbi:putative alanine aminotransferase, mitochondrial [Folsomia candida]|uniref:Putative alanine aminotransferase, mitochondrial n=1 Tax=Folsomia candida TaxID=158441 RepID=A0A226E9L2_FOLCA|nr:putative alanine aminotransferase, mitochondrial [Folsomia candida]
MYTGGDEREEMSGRNYPPIVSRTMFLIGSTFLRQVYQLTLLSSEPFISLRKVVAEMNYPFNKVELISFNSISKGFTNEPNLRGGYMEIFNVDLAIRAVLVQLLSVKQCPNLMGQAIFAHGAKTKGMFFVRIEKTLAILLQMEECIGTKLTEYWTDTRNAEMHISKNQLADLPSWDRDGAPNIPQARPIEGFWALIKKEYSNRQKPPKNLREFIQVMTAIIKLVGKTSGKTFMATVRKKLGSIGRNGVFGPLVDNYK